MRAWWTVLFLVGCGKPLDGFWLGGVECDRIPFQLEFMLAHDSKRIYTGSGEQSRDFTDPITGTITETSITFDITAELVQASGAQDLDVSFTCTDETTLQYLEGRAEPEVVGEGCEPTRFRDWGLAWDGEEQMTVDDPEGCAGVLALKE